LSVIARVEGLIPDDETFGLLGLFIAWGVVITPILMFGYVLHPTRKSVSRLEASKRDDIQRALHIDPLQNQRRIQSGK
jgi:hypothetical protein